MTLVKQLSVSKPSRFEDERWSFIYNQFMDLVDEDMREHVLGMVSSIHGSGEGLRCWINDIAYRGRVMPKFIPKELLLVYSADSEAMPLHDCADCGLSVPVRPNRLYGGEGEPEESYFPNCPICGGRTGLYFYWSSRKEADAVARSKPR